MLYTGACTQTRILISMPPLSFSCKAAEVQGQARLELGAVTRPPRSSSAAPCHSCTLILHAAACPRKNYAGGFACVKQQHTLIAQQDARQKL